MSTPRSASHRRSPSGPPLPVTTITSHAQARGARLVIVVTGKGGPQGSERLWDAERGVLKRLTPHWLRDPDMRTVVLGFEEAGRAHGGSGALYVRLRRPA